MSLTFKDFSAVPIPGTARMSANEVLSAMSECSETLNLNIERLSSDLRLLEKRLRVEPDPSGAALVEFRNALDDTRSESVADTEGDEGYSYSGYSGSEYDGTPTKRLKSSGTFEQVLKRKENGPGDRGSNEQLPDRADFKRRRV